VIGRCFSRRREIAGGGAGGRIGSISSLVSGTEGCFSQLQQEGDLERRRRGRDLVTGLNPGRARDNTTTTITTTTTTITKITTSPPPTTTTTTTMSSDADYAAFLEKANQDPSSGLASKKGLSEQKQKSTQIQLKTVDRGVSVPEGIQAKTESEEWIYVSDADEPFVGVALKLGVSGGLPDEVTFAQLINHPSPGNGENEITILDPTEWDRRGHYKEVVDAVRKACQGNDVRVYRVPIGRAKVEYWLVGVDDEGGKLVGVKALGVES